MAERDEPPQDGAEGAEPRDPAGGAGAPLDEEAAWAQIVAGYGEEPELPDGWPEAAQEQERATNSGVPEVPREFVIRAPRSGPRDYEVADDEDEDEGHFVPPEPPPLPPSDVTTKFAWIAVLGGPLLVLGFVLFQEPLTWWAMLLGVGGFLGGFTTLVARMKGREEDDDPHGGAVV
ncbi:hypothetical protein [Streptomyces sp. RPT161]|uniref:hypothetical protein n=1 Tax=Streptomyces sp. RPT161 TaxID=3015993 RepID=UPI0022B93E5A|nr:hypothetical protein [Streptomyces sp. RPT161]